MSKSIYVVYECDKQRSKNSMCVKYMSDYRSDAITVYQMLKDSYSGTDWYLNAAVYKVPSYKSVSGHSNALWDLNYPFLTTENES